MKDSGKTSGLMRVSVIVSVHVEEVSNGLERRVLELFLKRL